MTNNLIFNSYLKKDIKRFSLFIVSCSLFAFGIWHVGIEDALTSFQSFPIWALGFIVLLFVINLLIVSYRLKYILFCFKQDLPFKVAIKACLQGHLVSLLFISLLGQVFGRQFILRRYGIPPMSVAMITIVEKVILLFVGVIVGTSGIYYLIGFSDIAVFIEKVSLIQIILAVTFSLIMIFRVSNFPINKERYTNTVSIQNLYKLVNILSITVIAQGLVLCSFVTAAKVLVPEIDLWALIAAAAFTSFAASLPISVNGWGVREVAAVFSFGLVGMPSASALAVSVLVGIISSLSILMLYPFFRVKIQDCRLGSRQATPSNLLKKELIPLERIGALCITLSAVIFVFFQVHISLKNGIINVNLADAFALISLAIICLISIEKRSLPSWRILYFNQILFVISLLMFLSFLNGIQIIGVTQWALVSRLFGWIVLLGYLSIGLLSAIYFGQRGTSKLIDSLIITASVIIIFQVLMRTFDSLDWLDLAFIPPNFEGFSGNRNAFAYQLVICSLLLISFSERNNKFINRLIAKEGEISNLSREYVCRNKIFYILHAIIIAGIILTGSRAGILTEFTVIIFSLFFIRHNRVSLLQTVILGLVVWFSFVWILPLLLQFVSSCIHFLHTGEFLRLDELSQFVQTGISNPVSNIERWESIKRGVSLWLDYPIFGAGLGVFIEQSTQWFSRPLVIHSTPIWILAEFGIVGVVIFLTILIYSARSLIKLGYFKPYHYAILLLLLVFVVFGLAHEIFNQRFFWLVLGICLAQPLYKTVKY